MLNQIDTENNVNVDNVVLTTEAASAVKSILAERNLEGYALRVYVSGSGCSGPRFGMALDNNVHANDQAFDTEGVRVVVDDQSITYLRGAKIDFVNDPQRGAGFTVQPAMEFGGSCNCGSESGGGGCGCGGGSCGCNN